MKKIISLLICFLLVFSMFSTVSADGELSNASNYSIGTFQNGTLAENNKSDSYKFNIPTSGSLDISFEANFEYILFNIYDEDGKVIYSHNEHWNATLSSLKCNKTIELTSGNYFISVQGVRNGYAGNFYGNYGFILNFKSANETYIEEKNGTNNTLNTSIPINFSSKYNGHLSLNDTKDIYRFNLASSSKINFAMEGSVEYLYVNIYDSNGNSIWSHCEHWNGTMNYLNCTKEIELTHGDYFISIEGVRVGYAGNFYGNYSFMLNYESANESFMDSNNAINEASVIRINQKYNGHLALNDLKDIYRLNVPSSSKITFSMEGTVAYLYANIYDSNGNSIWSHCEHWNGTMNYLNCTKEIELTHGDYFISIEGVRVGYAGNFYGKYSFSLSDGGKIIDAPIPDPNPGIKVLVNGVPVQFDQPPVLENGRTLVPLRAIFEALGANVGWDDATQTVTATKNGIQISLQIGSTQMYVNGNVKTLDVPAKLINSRTLVPVRAVSEAFGCKVDWINDTQTGVITQ